ncbi:MerR family transcriptional regulator [Nonomuraea sp. NPDC049725]|uniref:MerR family transcriptional regulator n=1 Tax=Nonomuraea sp. NPDC049725 TaxID=3154508 RepID=UPI003421252F
MRIGDLAHRTGVHRRLLRYYEEQGLLSPARLVNGYREYSEADIATVRHIRAMLAAGLPTAVIGRVLHCVHDTDTGLPVPADCPAFIEALHHQRTRIADAIAALQTSQDLLDALLNTAQRRRA